MEIETATSSQANKEYNEQLDVIESLYEFHPEFFDGLTPELLKAANEYYLLSQQTPKNVFEYRLALLQRDPTIGAKAKNAYEQVLRISAPSS
jgi:hypothetical protein